MVKMCYITLIREYYIVPLCCSSLLCLCLSCLILCCQVCFICSFHVFFLKSLSVLSVPLIARGKTVSQMLLMVFSF